MKTPNSWMPESVEFLAYNGKVENAKAFTDDEIQEMILLSAKGIAEIKKKDPDPIIKVESINYPVAGTGGVYEGSFFKSFINVTKSRAIPGSKRGHEYTSRPSSDFYMVGGKCVDNADGTGTAYFVMMVPSFGDTTSNEGFQRDINLGIVNFSLVSSPMFKEQKDADGIVRRHFTKTNGYERNDAVEFGAGAMDQVVNSSFGFDLAEAERLVNENKYNTDVDSESVIESGIVYRSALRRLVSRANGQDVSRIGQIISQIDKKENGGKRMDHIEAMKTLSIALTNSTVSLAEIIRNCGLEGKVIVVTDEYKAREALTNSLVAKLGDNPVEALDAMITESKRNAEATVENKLVDAFGAKKIKNGADEKANPAYEYALKVCNGKAGKDLDDAIAALKDDVVMISLRQNMADPTSQINLVEKNKKHAEAGDTGARKLMEV